MRGAELQAGDRLGRYQLESLLGEGGMGLVFRATDDGGEVVALKLLKLDLSDDDVFKQRFKQEARAAAEVQNENLVPILEAGEADGRDYLAVGYVEGGTLDDRIRESGPLSVEDTVSLASGLGSGLDALHAAGIVHRDIKASNIILRSGDGRAMLTDFGLAKGRAYTVLTRPGQVMGTLDYLAPELIKGKPGGARDRHLCARLHGLRLRDREDAVRGQDAVRGRARAPRGAAARSG